MSTTEPAKPDPVAQAALRHLRFGWWSLAVFLCLGALLEAMHAWKVDWYLAVGNETRRLLWRLAHAHGGLLALVHVLFGLCLGRVGKMLPYASAALFGAAIALPGGFLLGGIDSAGGDPGAGILLVPLGFLLLLAAVVGMARQFRG